MLLMSIKPCFVDSILDGSKRYELRRRSPKAGVGDTVAVYSTAPVMAINAVFTIGSIVEDSVDDLWPIVARECGVSREMYSAYFFGAHKGSAIRIVSPNQLARPISLGELRREVSGFSVPQSFRRLSAGEMRVLRRAAKVGKMKDFERSLTEGIERLAEELHKLTSVDTNGPGPSIR